MTPRIFSTARGLASKALAGLAALLMLTATPHALAQNTNPTYRFATSLGNIDVKLRPDVAPATVANFLAYVGTGAYSSSIIHRSVPGFVIQGGGYAIVNGALNALTASAAIQNEASLAGHLSNTRGTIAMALTGTDINSATSQWFFNLVDNSASLDSQHFTVFGTVANPASLAVMDAIAAAKVIDASSTIGAPFNTLPVINYTAGASLALTNLITVSSIQLAPAAATPDYAITASPASLTVTAGQTASTTLSITPSNGYAGTVQLACGTLPASASCTFAPTSVTFAATDTAAKTATLTVATSAHTAAVASISAGDGGGGATLIGRTLLAVLALAVTAGAVLRTRGQPVARRLRRLARPLAFTLATATLASCGGSDSSSDGTTTLTPAGTYSVPITVTDGTTSHPFTLSVTVQ